MKVQCILREAELKEAIMEYIIKEGYPVEGMDINFNLIKGRTSETTRVEVDLIPKGEKTETVVEPEVVAEVEAIEEVEETVIETTEEDDNDLFANNNSDKDLVESEVSGKSLFS